MDEEEQLRVARDVIKSVFLKGDLPQFIGESLGKDGVLFAFIDTPGCVLVVGNSTPGALNDKRNAIMIRQMAELLQDNMKSMMQTAGSAVKEG
jgi:hypothetical protein